MAATSTMLSRTSRMSRKVYMPREKAGEARSWLNAKYAETYGSTSSDVSAPWSAVADRRPAFRLEARAANEQSVHARRRKQRRRIGRRDTSAVENGDRVALRARDRLELGADRAMR